MIQGSRSKLDYFSANREDKGVKKEVAAQYEKGLKEDLERQWTAGKRAELKKEVQEEFEGLVARMKAGAMP